MSNKTTVQTHSETGGAVRPAVNVKVYNVGPDPRDIEDRFGCSTERAVEALETAWRAAQDLFWHHEAPRIARDVFGDHVQVWTEGRSGGWLVVEGLPSPITDWSPNLVEAWETFENRIRSLVDSLSDDDEVMRYIDDNGLWLESHDVTVTIEECGCCGQWHPAGAHVDCRDDAWRLQSPERAELIYRSAPKLRQSLDTVTSYLSSLLDCQSADEAHDMLVNHGKLVESIGKETLKRSVTPSN